MTHETFREMLPLYVIGALDGDELYKFERHVAENRELCNMEIAEYQAIADQIALAAEPAQPSPAVYGRIAAAVEEVKRPVAAAKPTPAVAPVPVRPTVSKRPEPEGSNPVALIFRFMPWAAAAVLAILLFSAYGQIREVTHQLQSMTSSYNDLIGRNNDQQGKLTQQQGSLADVTIRLDAQIKETKEFKDEMDRLLAKNGEQQHDLETVRTINSKLADEKDALVRAADQMREQLERQTLQSAALQKKMTEQADSFDLVMDPATRVSPLVDPKAQTKAVAKVYWQGAKKTGFMVVSNLVPVAQDQGKCLELWAICGTEPPVPAGIGWTDGSGHGMMQVKLARDMTCIDKFAVTVERAGGAPAPEGSIILIGQ